MSRTTSTRARSAPPRTARFRRWAALFALVVVGLLYAAPGRAASSGQLFPREADLFVLGEGLSYLSLPAEVLKDVRPDLSDIRLFNADGSEVPYFVYTARPRAPSDSTQRIAAPPLEVRQERRRDADGSTRRRERIVIAMPRIAPETGAWDLVFAVPRGHFVRRIAVREDAGKGRVLAEGTIFRLLSPLRERTRITLPADVSGRVEVTIESEDDERRYLEPDLAFESARAPAGSAQAAVPLAEVSRSRGEGRTIVHLIRPRGIVPNALRIETSTGTFYRPVEVWDEGAGHVEGRLGSTPIFRVETLSSVRDMEVPLAPARGDRLRVEIADRDSPELGDLRVFAVIERPSLIFSLAPRAEGPSTPAGVVRFGGARAHRPSYDLEGLRQAMGSGTAWELADRLRNPAEVREAKLGEVRPNPTFDPSPALGFAMRPAAEIDASGYSHRMRLTVAAAPEGVSRYRLPPEALAVARGDLGDIRVVDEKGRQWPYLIEESADRQPVAMTIDPPRRKDGRSHYDFRPTAAPLSLEEVVLDIRADYLEREYGLTGQVEGGGELVLSRGKLTRRPGTPQEVSIAVPRSRVTKIELVVVDGDEAPIDLRGARAVIPLPDLYVVAPAGSYTLFVGQATASAPRYELSQARELVFSVSTAAIEASPLEANPGYKEPEPKGRRESFVLWAVLVLAVLTLGALTLRLANREGPGGAKAQPAQPAQPTQPAASATPTPSAEPAAPTPQPVGSKEAAPGPAAPPGERELTARPSEGGPEQA